MKTNTFLIMLATLALTSSNALFCKSKKSSKPRQTAEEKTAAMTTEFNTDLVGIVAALAAAKATTTALQTNANDAASSTQALSDACKALTPNLTLDHPLYTSASNNASYSAARAEALNQSIQNLIDDTKEAITNAKKLVKANANK